VETVTLNEAKKHLDELLDRAAAGEEVQVTRKGKAIARIVAIASGKKPVDVTALRAMVMAMPISDNDAVRQTRDEARY
jgi:prevent-host-death family protein